MKSDTIMTGHIMKMAHSALNHNALVVQLASEVIAAGPVGKSSELKRIHAEFNKLHKAYEAEMSQNIANIAKDIAEGHIHE